MLCCDVVCEKNKKMLMIKKKVCDAFWKEIKRNLGKNKPDFIGPYTCVIFCVCICVSMCIFIIPVCFPDNCFHDPIGALWQ